MDNRAWASGASATPPSAPASPSIGYPTAGDPLTAVPATKPGPYWFYQLGEELRAVQVAAGITPNTANNAQLLEAIQRLIDAQSGNYALDTGAANAYVVALSPAITAYGDGLTVRVKAVNANTGAATLNAGGGAAGLVNDVGGALVAGDVPAGGVFTATYIASANKFYITSLVASQSLTQVAADARYAKLAGLLTQVFEAADGTTGKQVVNISQFVESLASNGYLKLPGGLIVQWGATGNITAGSALAVTYPIAFPTGMAGCSVSPSYITVGAVANYMTHGNTSASQLTINNVGAVTCAARWIAIGY